MADAVLSGAVRISSTSNIMTRAFHISVAGISAYFTDEFILAAGVSEFVVSINTLSAPQYVFVTANNVARINYSGHASYVSAASAGWPFNVWAQAGSGILSGPVGLHFANSGTNSALITVFAAQ